MICRGTWQHGTWCHDSHLATNVVAHFNVGGSLGHSSRDSFLTNFMKWHCSLNSPVSRTRNCRDLKSVSFPALPVLSYHHITKQGLTLLRPRYQISSVLPGNLWTVSITLKALSSKCWSFYRWRSSHRKTQHLSQGQRVEQWKSWDTWLSVCIPLLSSTTSTCCGHFISWATARWCLNFAQQPQVTWFLDSSSIYRC